MAGPTTYYLSVVAIAPEGPKKGDILRAAFSYQAWSMEEAYKKGVELIRYNHGACMLEPHYVRTSLARPLHLNNEVIPLE